MVGRISPQTPEPGSHQHCSESPRAACYSLPTLFAARTKQLTPSSAPRGANISPVLSSFRILPVATGVYPASFPRFRRSDLRTCQLFCLQRLGASLPSFAGPRPLFSMACSLFLQNTRGGGMSANPPFEINKMQTLCLRSTPTLRSRRGKGGTHYPPLTTHFPVPPHSVLNSRLSCPEAGQP
jgi:hypothetical protein